MSGTFILLQKTELKPGFKTIGYAIGKVSNWSTEHHFAMQGYTFTKVNLSAKQKVETGNALWRKLLVNKGVGLAIIVTKETLTQLKAVIKILPRPHAVGVTNIEAED